MTKPKIKRQLSTKETRIAAQILRRDYELSFSKIALALGIDKKTAFTYVNAEVKEEDQRFYSAVRQMIETANTELEGAVLAKMKELIPSFKKHDWYKLIDTVKMLREEKTPGVAAPTVQVQNILGDFRKEAQK